MSLEPDLTIIYRSMGSSFQKYSNAESEINTWIMPANFILLFGFSLMIKLSTSAFQEMFY